jgi:hypothetical protein
MKNICNIEMCPCHIKNPIKKITIPNPLCTKDDRTDVSGKSSKGKITFLITCLLSKIEDAPLMTPSWNANHGKRPDRRKARKGILPVSVCILIFKICANTIQ